MPKTAFVAPKTPEERQRNYCARKMYKSARARGFDKDHVKGILLQRYGFQSSRDCTVEQLQEMREHFKTFPLPNAPKPKRRKVKFAVRRVNGERRRV